MGRRLAVASSTCLEKLNRAGLPADPKASARGGEGLDGDAHHGATMRLVGAATDHRV